jgi:hypothetical protein
MNTILDEMFNRIKNGINVKAWWDELKKIYEGRSRDLCINLSCKLQNTSCTEDDDVRAHFAKLANYQEQLASMGEMISDDQYANMLLASLPACYDMCITAITTNTNETGNLIKPKKVVKLITDDYNKRLLHKNGDNKAEDLAFVVSTQKRDLCNLECYNCKKKGHIKANCWAKGGRKEGQWLQRRSGKNKGKDKNKDNNTAAAALKEEDIRSWAAIIEDLDDLKEYDKVSILDLDEDNISWMSEDISNEDQHFIEGASEVDKEDNESWTIIEEISHDEDLASFEEMPESATITTNVNASKEAELYDLGVSWHISPFRQCFTTYHTITPHPITIANKRTFYTVGTGDLHIEVSNRSRLTPILLKDALHMPDIGLTVVSIGWITGSSHTVAFKGNECQIKDQNDIIIGRIPISANGIYKV